MNDSLPLATGKVWLVGAGPGDPELLTLRAARLIMQAGLIVHDGLVDPAILAMARPGARLVSVAKRRSRHTMPQDAINALLVVEALAGLATLVAKQGVKSPAVIIIGEVTATDETHLRELALEALA